MVTVSSAPRNPSGPDAVRLHTVTGHSDKIIEFFGTAPDATYSSRSLVDGNVNDLVADTRASGVYNLLPRLKPQHPAMKHHARRTTRALSGLILSCTPICFAALRPLSTALFLASLALYLPVSVLFLLRILFFPRATLRAVVHDRDTSGLELGYLSAWPTAFVLYVLFAAFAVAEGDVGGRAGRALVLAVYVLWWVGAAWAAATVLFVLAVLLGSRGRAGNRTPGGRVAPLIGFLVGMTSVATVALVGGLVVGLRTREGEVVLAAGLAAPVVVFSFCAVGAVLFLSGFDYAVVLHELVLVTGWPPQEQTSVVFSLVGPLGQCAAALLVLANAARRDGDGPGATPGIGIGAVVGSRAVTGLTAMRPLQLVCVLLALLAGGMAVTWLMLAFITVFYRLCRGELFWNPSWNGVVSPVVTLAILSVLLGRELESPFFGIAACVIIISSALMLIVNLAFTVRLVVSAKEKKPDVSATEPLVST
ncbi:hypothetical protein BT67DRAFT_431445 [Trichocladium antarcticum]|uniref:Uncharacterized protein n=1 Tax=Trichocladium antarcticum TaxID=1450529 RepID=A0AAN6UU53_9PEZI|nr:hypothetical protein BT67DRAFT_431445 [Trichocladium antarcticum]